jgi:hypothetical protein
VHNLIDNKTTTGEDSKDNTALTSWPITVSQENFVGTVMGACVHQDKNDNKGVIDGAAGLRTGGFL